jgi:mono/diheme cytochrome c family protein
MAAIAFLLFWILVAGGLFLVAISGGARGAREQVLQAQGRGGRRAATAIITLAFLVFGVALPTYVIARNKDSDEAGKQGIPLNASEKRGQEIFGRRCNECHTLAAANTAGRVGPNLDKLRPPASLVLDAVTNGRTRGVGTMPAKIVQGRDAKDVAAFVAKVAGRD